MSELREYHPSWRDRLAIWLQRAQMPRESVRGLVGSTGQGMNGPMMGGGLVDILPNPVGPALWLNESHRAHRSGDNFGAAVNAMAALPGGVAARGALQKAAKPIRAYQGSPHVSSPDKRLAQAKPRGLTSYMTGGGF